MLKLYDERAWRIHEEIEQREDDNNIRFYRKYRLKYNNKPASRSINELIHWIDATHTEKRYLIKKFLITYDLINTQSRVNIKGISKTPLAMKYYYRLNLYGELGSVRNQRYKARECPCCSSIKTWEHVV